MRMKQLSRVIAVLLLVGCQNLEAPAPSQATRLVVHAMLDTQSDVQTVLVYRARTGVPNAIEARGVSDDEPVSDAQVSIVGPDGVTLGAGRPSYPSGECCVTGTYVIQPPLPFPLGGTYTLRIRTPLGEEVTGTTTVPGPARLVLDTPRTFFRLRDTLRLSWPRVPGARSYEVMIRLDRFDNEYRTFTDTSFTIAGTALTIAGDEIFFPGQDANVVVSAVDVNYYDFYRSQSDPFAGAAPSHITGAVGVFGSINPIFATVLLVR